MFNEDLKELQQKQLEYEVVYENITQKVFNWANKICPTNKKVKEVFILDNEIYINVVEKWLWVFSKRVDYEIEQFIEKCKSNKIKIKV